jgi:hypothetical protein
VINPACHCVALAGIAQLGNNGEKETTPCIQSLAGLDAITGFKVNVVGALAVFLKVDQNENTALT